MMFICTDIDECDKNPNLCTPGGTCENLNGNFYTCNCDAGFEPDGGDASAGTLGCRGTSA